MKIKTDKTSQVPLYIQLYDAIANEISSGFIANGDKLPSRRELALSCGVSENTVSESYRMLVDTGYAVSIPKHGHYVRFESREFEDIPWDIKAGEKYIFTPNAVDISSFNRGAYAKILRGIAYGGGDAIFSPSEKNGEHALRFAIAKHLSSVRGIHCSPDRIVIGAGAEYLLMQLVSVLGCENGIAMEAPGYSRSYYAFCDAGKTVVPIPISGSGLKIQELEDSGCSVFYCMPHCHYPTGYKMSAEQKNDLLSWAERSPSRYIIEDGYDSELVREAPDTLCESDRGENVIFLDTFSRTLYPGIKLAYMILPQNFVARWKKRHILYSSLASKIEQYALAEYIEKGHYARRCKDLRRSYAAKRELLCRELVSYFGGSVSISPHSDSTNVMADFDCPYSADEIKRRFSRHGVKALTVGEYSSLHSPYLSKREFLLGIGLLNLTQIRLACRAMCDALNE